MTQTAFDLSGLPGMSPEEAVNTVLQQAIERRASDVHLMSEKRSHSIALRRNGTLQFAGAVPAELGRAMIVYIKANAGMDITEHRRPLDGRWLVDDGRVDVRINILPTMHGEDICMRIWSRTYEQLNLAKIGFFPSDLASMEQLLNAPSGLILVTGPTGTGKTTTLYACLQQLNRGLRKINTLEDPVEYLLPGIRQSQVNAKIGVDFPELLRSVLRQAPDVIMVGEIRDPQTAQIAVRAANSGHLVFATIHSQVAAAAIRNLLFFDVSPHFLADCLLAVVSQRLYRRLCPECRAEYRVDEGSHMYEEVDELLGPGQQNRFFGAHGCDACFGEGYDARGALIEMLKVNRATRQLIAGGGTLENLQRAAIEYGMIEFRRGALLKIAAGETSPEEILRVIPVEHLGIGE